MKNETNEAKKSKEKTEGIDDFKNDIDQMRSKTKDQRLLAALIVLVVLVFLSLGVGFYQIFIKPVPIEETKTSEEKIESKPEIPAQETPAPQQEQPQPQAPAPVPAPQPTTNEPTAYTVQSGDTWSTIANANGMTSKQLMDYNGATNEDLQIGQKIKIPKS
jgi:LysM repeat protein